MQLWGRYRKMSSDNRVVVSMNSLPVTIFSAIKGFLNNKWVQRVFFLVLLLGIFIGYPWYNVLNPGDKTVARGLDNVVGYGMDHLILWGFSLLVAIVVGIAAGILI